MAGDWQGDHPYCLTIAVKSTEGWQAAVVDLDERGWATTHADLLRTPGRWYLVEKLTNIPILGIIVNPGEQPYYTAKHVGIAFGGSGEVTCYGIGKKRLDGHVDRLWIMPNGMITAGDDVEPFGAALLKGGL